MNNRNESVYYFEDVQVVCVNKIVIENLPIDITVWKANITFKTYLHNYPCGRFIDC